jgi:hypothetical protein
MREAFEFTYQNSELDLGSYCLGGDWLLKLATDDEGLTFRLIDAESCSKGVSKAGFALVEEWIAFDTAPRARGAAQNSLVRQAFNRARIERDERREDDRAEWGLQFLPAAE